MPTLFEITAGLKELADFLADADGGELSPEAALLADRWFGELATDQAAKLDGYVALIRRFEMEAAAAKEEAERYLMIVKARENAAKRLKQRLHDHLTATGQAKVVTATGRTVAIQRNGGKPALDLDATATGETVDSRFAKLVPAELVIDKDAVRAALEAGEELPFARLKEVGSSLRIR